MIHLTSNGRGGERQARGAEGRVMRHGTRVLSRAFFGESIRYIRTRFELTVLENRFWMACSVTKGHEPQNCFLLRCYSPPFPCP